MAKISYVNGQYVHHHDAYVHMEDRGYQFADGIYEVIAFYNRIMVDADLHLARFARSMRELDISPPMNGAAMRLVIPELIARNDRTDGTLYMQVTRGVAKRDHIFPKPDSELSLCPPPFLKQGWRGLKVRNRYQLSRSALTMAVTGPKIPKEQETKNGVSVITTPDLRWARRDIKTIALLPNVLAKQAAAKAGAREAWLVDAEGMITEGAVSNNAIVNGKGEIITHPLTNAILGGCTRAVVLQLAKKAGYKVIERAFSLKEAKAAKEAFITGTTSNVLPVVKIDDTVIGTGMPGEVTQTLLAAYLGHITKLTGKQWN